jgi:hypothetical protein
MDEKIVDQLLDELVSSLEETETQSTAIMLFLKGEGIATEQKLAPYLEQAGKASDVRWRAARARMGALLHSALKPAEPSERKPDGDGGAKKTEKDGADRTASSNNKSPAGEKPEKTSPQNEQSDASKASGDAKSTVSGKTSGDTGSKGSSRAGNSQATGSESPSDSETSNDSNSQPDKTKWKN